MLGPIFVREFLTLPRRPNHYAARTVYLGVLWILALTAWQAAVGWDKTATLGDKARFSLVLFQVLCLLQLTLLLFFGALAAANNICTEKDRRTFVLLLMTDLRNYEIVLGKLFGSLLQIYLLLVATIPIFTFLLLLGGVAEFQIRQAIIVMAATVLAAGSLGTLVSLWRDKTFQSLALTVLFMVLYLCLVHALVIVPSVAGLVPGWYVSDETVGVWQQWLEPFMALHSAIEPQPDQHYQIAPAYGFALSMLALAVFLNAMSIWRLRAWNPRGEPIQQREQQEEEEEEKERANIHAAPGPVRNVWPNPILWREMVTRAYGRRTLLIKLAYYLVVALIGYYAIAPIIRGDEGSAWASAYGLVPLGILSLLLVAAQAVTAITTERDLRTLDLLLVTDLSPQEFIFGKLIGILWNTKEFLLPPLALAVFYGSWGYLATPPHLSRNLEAMVLLLLVLLVLMTFTLVLGIYVALRTPLSRLAIVNALGTVFFLSVGTLVCIGLILVTGNFVNQWLSFVFFLIAGIGGLVWVLCSERSSTALMIASTACPLAVFYSVTSLLVGRPGTRESADPLWPFVVMAGAFGFTVAAMLIPLLSEFDEAMGRTTGEAD